MSWLKSYFKDIKNFQLINRFHRILIFQRNGSSTRSTLLFLIHNRIGIDQPGNHTYWSREMYRTSKFPIANKQHYKCKKAIFLQLKEIKVHQYNQYKRFFWCIRPKNPKLIIINIRQFCSLIQLMWQYIRFAYD